MRKITSALVAFLLASPFAFAEVGLLTNGTPTGADQNVNIKNTSSATTTWSDGFTLSIPVLDPNLFAAGTGNGGGVSQVSGTVAVSSTASFIQKVLNTNGDSTFTAGTLANGKPGQILTIYAVGTAPTANSASGNWTITPTTKTGFQSVKLTTKKDSVTFLYIDDTTGWVIMNYAGSVVII